MPHTGVTSRAHNTLLPTLFSMWWLCILAVRWTSPWHQSRLRTAAPRQVKAREWELGLALVLALELGLGLELAWLHLRVVVLVRARARV